jgi:predicted DNA-binding transcriptional regulator AlpA
MLDQLIKEYPDLSVTIKALHLKEFGENIADKAVKSYIEKKDEKVYSRKEVIEKFGICEATLWRWAKIGLIEQKKIGNRVFYPESEIKRLANKERAE